MQVQFVFREYNHFGRCTLEWEGMTEDMATYYEKYFLFISNRDRDTVRLTADTALENGIEIHRSYVTLRRAR